MPEPRWTEISASEATVLLTPADFCCPHAGQLDSPIDGVYLNIQSLVVLGAQPALDANPVLGRLLLLGFVSSVDDYFRRVLSRLVSICPLARPRVSDRQVPFGAMDYYDPSQTGLALFENVSFSSVKDVANHTKSVAGLHFPEKSSVAIALERFEHLCHMRHAATHAGGALNSRNARELGLASGGTVHQVILNENRLQTAAGVCYSAVRAYNRWLYRGVVEQWIGTNLLSADWSLDRQLLGRFLIYSGLVRMEWRLQMLTIVTSPYGRQS